MDLSKLKEPFDPDRVSWRIGSTDENKTRGLALAYIDARDVQDRFDAVCGPENWANRYLRLGDTTICEIGIRVAPALMKWVAGTPGGGHSELAHPSDWVWKADGAGATDVEAEKGALSDSFKRAAVKWGVGRYLYDLDSPWVRIEPAGRSFKIAATEKERLRKLLTTGEKTLMKDMKEVERKSEAQTWVDSSIETIFQFEKEDQLQEWEHRATAAIIRLKKVDPALHERLLEKIMLRYEQLGKAA